MKRKVLCIALALLMSMMVTIPSFAENSEEPVLERAGVTFSFGLKQISVAQYRMWARIDNPVAASISASVALYDVSYNYITSSSTTSSATTINLSKYVSLSSGTYHVRLTIFVNGSIYSSEHTYNI